MNQSNGIVFIPSYVMAASIFAVITPYLPLLVSDLGYSTVMVGILLGIFEGAGIAGPILFGLWADRTGRYRLPLILSCIIPAIIAFPLAFLVHPLASALLLAVMGFGFRSNTPLLDAVTTIQIGKSGNYGKIRVWGSVGFVIFTLYFQWTPFLRPVSAVNIAFWIMLICIAAIVPIIFLPLAGGKTSHLSNKKTKAVIKNQTTEKKPAKKIISAYFFAGIILIFFGRFSMTSFNSFFPLYLTQELQWDAVGLIFAIAVSAEIPLLFFSHILIRRFGALPLLALSTLAVFIRLMIWALFPYKPVIICTQLLHSLCFGIYYPAAIDFISQVFPPEKRGFGMSIFLVIGAGLPMIIGNMIGGVIIDLAGYRSLFAIYAVLSGAAVIVYGILHRKITKS